MKANKQTTAIVFVGVISILSGFVLGYLSGLKYRASLNKGHTAEISSAQPLPARSPALNLAAASTEIIKELNCVCSCKMELATCTCTDRRGALEIKTFVQMQVQQGVPKAEIIKRLVLEYGEAILIKKA